MTLDDADQPGRWPDESDAIRNAKPPEPTIQATPFTWRDPASLPTRDWLYGHVLIRKFLTVTVAPGGVGKTMLSVVEALALASGRPLLGIQPPRQLRTWLLNLEDPKEELERRIHGACIHYGLDDADVGGHLFLDSGRDTPCVIVHQGPDGLTIAEPVVDALISTIRKHRIDVLNVDPFVSSHGCNENDNSAVDRVAKTWGYIAERTGCAIHLVHHARKTGGNEVTMEDSRGAVALLAAARVGRVLNVMSKDEAERAGVENHRQYFRMANGKANLAPAAEGSTWFRLASVHLGNGPEGHEGDSVGVVEPWHWPNPTADVTAADLLTAQKAIGSERFRQNAQANDWVGKPIARALGIDLDEPRGKAKVKALVAMWLKSGALATEDGKDENRKMRSYVVVGTWAF